ncbi:type 1 fimbrial major subunit FimA [Serratia ureilytica]|uniref:type 1 fimbrial major subunit FimA n=1 Tax=Serratia ureilytica TaxID=300181 RepID=UPI0027DA3763|nr:type 1 fimbrial major subunit FimA [Serratia ureilytica]
MLNKQRVIKSVLAAALLSAGTMATAATTVPGGTVHFTGQIVNAACAVSAGSTDQTVNLGQYRTANFKAVGDRSGAVPFKIQLQDCDTSVSTQASVAFSGTAVSSDADVLAVSNISGGASGSASGVGIEIGDHTGKVLPPNGSVFSTAQTLIDGVNVLNFTARYKATAASVTPGQADADATFTMQYN